MTSWTDLLQVLATQDSPKGRRLPIRPPMIREDLWDHQRRIDELEAEVKSLKDVITKLLRRLNEKEGTQ